MFDKSVINSIITFVITAILAAIAYGAIALKDLITYPPLHDQVSKNSRDILLGKKEREAIIRADKKDHKAIDKAATESQKQTRKLLETMFLEQKQTRVEGSKERKELSKQINEVNIKATTTETNVKNNTERLREYRSYERRK